MFGLELNGLQQFPQNLFTAFPDGSRIADLRFSPRFCSFLHLQHGTSISKILPHSTSTSFIKSNVYCNSTEVPALLCKHHLSIWTPLHLLAAHSRPNRKKDLWRYMGRLLMATFLLFPIHAVQSNQQVRIGAHHNAIYRVTLSDTWSVYAVPQPVSSLRTDSITIWRRPEIYHVLKHQQRSIPAGMFLSIGSAGLEPVASYC